MKFLTLLGTLLVLFSGCSSEPDSAEEAAIFMCKAAKEIDIKDMKALCDKSLHENLDRQYKLFTKLPKEQKDLLIQKLQKSPECEVSSVKALDNNISMVELKNMGQFKIQQQNEFWRVIQF